jgi:uncharacterized membrane protein (UPF0127 family)
VRVINQTRASTLATSCEVARSFLARGRGLMGRDRLDPGAGLLIDPCSSIHTFFMRFPIDVVFIDRGRRVVGLHTALPPGRPFAGAWGARAVIELPAGTIADTATGVGDQLLFDDTSA